MRWSYKTVHFGLKKDGLLGGAFLDDSEIEETLNEYGQGGWELVSMVDTRDGVIAVFKQPLDLHIADQTIAPPVRETRKAVSPVGTLAPRKRIYEPEPEPEEEPLAEEEEYPILDTYQDEPDKVEDEDEDDDQNSTIGSIRIE